MRNKVIVILFIIWFALLNVFILPVRDAEAVLPAVIAPEAITVVAALLTAAGITFATSADARAFASQVWYNMKTNVRNYISSILGTGSITITKELWDDLKSSADSVQDGEVKYCVLGQSITFESFDSIVLEPTDGYLSVLVTLGGIAQSIDVRYDNNLLIANVQAYAMDNDLDKKCIRVTSYHLPSAVEIPVESYANILVEVSIDAGEIVVMVEGQEVVRASTLYKFGKVTAGSANGVLVLSALSTAVLTEGQSYEKNPAYWGNPSWDLSGKTMAVPGSVDDVAGKTTEQIVDTTITDTITEPGVGDATDTLGWLGNIYTQLKYWLGNIVNWLSRLWDLVKSLPGQIVQAITGALEALFVPTVSFEAVMTEIKDAASVRAPFSWFASWQAMSQFNYGSEPVVFEWRPGLNDRNIRVEVAEQTAVRNLTTVIISCLALWAAYGEIRRFVG